jgi:hypothetical protein
VDTVNDALRGNGSWPQAIGIWELEMSAANEGNL